MATAKEIWKTLSAIDVSGKTEKKGNLTYLSWAWAWGTLMDNFPSSFYEFKEDTVYPDGSVMVHVSVQVCGIEKTMWLPVLDHRNKVITNPTAWDINTARMRCLTKCLAMFGLGHYIYAGEDLPEAVKQEKGLKAELFGKFKKAVKDSDPWLMAEVAEKMNDDWWKASYNSFKTDITVQKRNVDHLLSSGRARWKQACDDLRQNKADGHEDGMIEDLVKDIPSDYWQSRLRAVE